MVNTKGSSALHVCSYYGHYKIVEFLILNNADVNKKNSLGYIPE